MQVVLYSNFSKKVNSTKRPDGGQTVEAYFKENTSLESPVLRIQGVNLNVNYVFIPSIGHYYFVDDITVGNNNIYELSCTQDLLATYKDTIGNYTAFVERATSRFDAYINDNALSMQQAIAHKVKVNTGITSFSNVGCYLVRTVASNSNTETGLNTYCLTKGQMSTFINNAFNPTNYSDVFTDLLEEVVKAVFNPFEYIASVSWIPFTATDFSGSNAAVPIKLGWWELPNATGYPVRHEAFGTVTQVNKPPRFYNDFRDFNPQFTKATMWINGVGLIELDPRELKPESNLYVMYYIDCATGQANCYLRSGQSPEDSQSISAFPATLCAPVQLSQTSLNIEGVASNTLATVGSFASGNVPQTAVAGINTILDVVKPTTNLIGSQGTRASITAYMDIYIELTHYGSKQFPVNVVGRPLCENVKINTLSGYIKCGGASVDITGFANDKTGVNDFLNTGFYYE